jgi:hypothetical protein
MTTNPLLVQATKLEAEAARLRKQAFEERCMPDFWRIGQRVRYITDSEYAWCRGDIAQIVGFHYRYLEGTIPANEYQVFFTGHLSSSAKYWTTPSDVELICETSDD